jgi:hypothetical protein
MIHLDICEDTEQLYKALNDRSIQGFVPVFADMVRKDSPREENQGVSRLNEVSLVDEINLP